jgi:hypothetical protein
VEEGLLNPSPYFFYQGEVKTGRLNVSSANRQGQANHYFASTAPDRNDASLAVTVVELLRGDIPTILKNFQEMMAGYRSIRNYLGSDFLNITFGWTPLIQEYANLIKVGMGLDRALYYESFRRKRQWTGPVISGHYSYDISLGAFRSVYSNGGLAKPGGVIGPSTSRAASFSQDVEWVESEDYHFTSKYTGLAKASLRANQFSDQAADVLKRLGLVDNPRLIWDLTPYSWLVDWFSTMGDSLTNAAVYAPIKGKYSIDYAYVTTQHVQHIKGTLLRRLDTDSYMRRFDVVRPTSVATSTTRWRDRATPFGFGTQLGDLNATQYAILVALGLARSR